MRRIDGLKSIVASLCILVACASAMGQTSQPASSGAATQPATAPAPVKKISLGQAAILGVVEGVTEYLPVSSTGHLILTSYCMGLTDRDNGNAKFGKGHAVEAFEIVIQFGAILAVMGLYRRRVGQMGRGLMGRDPQGLRLAGLLMVAFLPAAVLGLLLHKTIQEHLFTPMTVTFALIVGGVIMIVAEYMFRKPGRDLSPSDGVNRMVFSQALIIGFAQVLAMWPGTSRSMVTIVAGLAVGLDMLAAAEFSFLLALPTLGAATFYEAFKSRHDLLPSAGWDGLLVGLVVSGIVAALAVKGFVRWLTRHGMIPFGAYRIALGIVLYLILTR